MKKRTNSVISSLYYPISNSKVKTAICMLVGGLILVFLGICLIVTTIAVKPPVSVSNHMDETSVLISGPTCLALGLVVIVLSCADMFRHRRAQNRVESELNRVTGSLSKPVPCARCGQVDSDVSPISSHPNVSIVINNKLWPS